MKTCLVVHATPQRQWIWRVQLADGDPVREALRLARELAGAADIPWDADVGIFGVPCSRDAVPRDGDRIEIYRPLRSDPKESRRARVAAGRAAPGREPARHLSRRKP